MIRVIRSRKVFGCFLASLRLGVKILRPVDSYLLWQELPLGVNLMAMKATDDYSAKIRFWAAEAVKPGFRPLPCPIPENLPPFSPQRFSSYAEFNEWKRNYLLEIARQGGVKWKPSSPN